MEKVVGTICSIVLRIFAYIQVYSITNILGVNILEHITVLIHAAVITLLFICPSFDPYHVFKGRFV